MKLLLFTLICFSLISFGNKNEVKLSFKNDSNENFEKLEVNIRGKKYAFANLKAHKKTASINVNETYRYCFTKVITEKDTLIIQPEDFVGEELITEGSYTMKFNIISKNGKRYLIVKK